MRACGCTLNNAYMQHSLLALVVIPELRISDIGLIDVTKFEKVDLFVLSRPSARIPMRCRATSATARSASPSCARRARSADESGEATPVREDRAGARSDVLLPAAWRSASRCRRKPTCAIKYRVSRYTAREALRRLRDAGLITRRRRAGSTVTAAPPRSTLALALGSAEDLLRYATETRFLIQQKQYIRAAGADLAVLELQARPGVDQAVGCACARGRPRRSACSTVYLHRRARRPRGAAAALLRGDLSAGGKGARRAHRLDRPSHRGARCSATKRRSACGRRPARRRLRVRRYYYDANERLLELSDSLHAAERFAYEMRLSRRVITPQAMRAPALPVGCVL